MKARRKVVIGGNWREFRQWCRMHDVSPMDAIYADTAEKLMGLELKREDIVDLGGAPDDVLSILPTRIR